MLFRHCAGGVVFFQNKVFLLKNDKSEWTLPKGLIKDEMLSGEVAIRCVKHECGVDAKVVSTAGETSYEFYSQTSRQPVCNEIVWYVLEAANDRYKIDAGNEDGGYFNVDDALRIVTYTQDKTIVKQAFSKYNKKK